MTLRNKPSPKSRFSWAEAVYARRVGRADRLQQLGPIVPRTVHLLADWPDLQHIIVSRSQQRRRITLSL